MNARPGQIIVGYDGSDRSIEAVEWAAAEAVRRQLPLLALHVADHGLVQGVGALLPWPPGLLQQAAQEVADEAVERARKVEPEVIVSARGAVGTVAHELLELSRAANLLVIGTRGHGGVLSAALGSVAYAVSAHAHCPVIVIRGDDTRPPSPDRAVVVGVDGSAPALLGLNFAADLAVETGAPLVIVSSYRSVATFPRPGSSIWALESGGRAEFDSVVEQAAEQIVAKAATAAGTGRPDLDVSTQVMDGSPVDTLSLAAAGRGLLVVGSRGRGGFEGLLLGSVSHSLLRTSPCPVAVVRDNG